jgi:hypothetical protein
VKWRPTTASIGNRPTDAIFCFLLRQFEYCAPLNGPLFEILFFLSEQLTINNLGIVNRSCCGCVVQISNLPFHIFERVCSKQQLKREEKEEEVE